MPWVLLSACSPSNPTSFHAQNFSATEDAPRNCANANPQRNAYFGDLHVHTAYSSDAYTQGMRATPFDAYRFSFGIKPSASLRANATEQAFASHPNYISRAKHDTLKRPLHFMAVTDHAEFLGETRLCASGNRDAKFCQMLTKGAAHNFYMLKFIFSPITWRDEELCGADGTACAQALSSAWQKTIEAAEQWNDTSDACERTTFVGFEYSSHRLGSNLHRNVIFKNARVLENPVSYIDANREWRLWEILDRECLNDPGGCDALAIPHNSNISNGRMFAVDYPNTFSKAAQRRRAQLRAKIEPIVEIMQHKGDSECYVGLPDVAGSEDELCLFEKTEHSVWRRQYGDEVPGACYDGPLADWIPHLGPDCLSSLSYVRYALIEGLSEWQRLGVNPYKMGIIAATDTHNATGGAVEEYDYRGHLGQMDGDRTKRLNRLQGAGSVGDNPGGLTGVWAEQNTRASLFTAMKRREVFGTSGPRIRPRFFGGWQYHDNLCDDEQWLDTAYARGVPMGDDLPVQHNSAQAPVFVVHALPDIGASERAKAPLQTLQIIKGWVDDDDIKQQRVYTIAADDTVAGSDENTCAVPSSNPPPSKMCKVWRDPDFNPERASVYYARVIQAPTCRYTHYQCQQLPKAERATHAICAGDERIAPKMIRERAWTSPIWYTPTH